MPQMCVVSLLLLKILSLMFYKCIARPKCRTREADYVNKITAGLLSDEKTKQKCRTNDTSEHGEKMKAKHPRE